MSIPSNRVRSLLAGLVALLSVAVLPAAPAHAAYVQAYNMTGFTATTPNLGYHYSLGYTFTVTQPTLIAGLGVLDGGGNTVKTTAGMPVNLYYSTASPSVGTDLGNGHASGDLVAGVTVTGNDSTLFGLDGGTYTSGDGFRYHLFDTPLLLLPGTYEVVSSPLTKYWRTNPANLTETSGLSGPLHTAYLKTSNTTVDGAQYGTSVYDSNVMNLGPNLLISSVPTPAALPGGAMLLGIVAFSRRRARA